MALSIPTNSQSDLISILSATGLTNAANATFFGSGTLSGTIENTNIDVDPIATPLINPADFPDADPRQIAALQNQAAIETAAINEQRQQVVDQFNSARRERLKINEDSLSATAQIFSATGGINPLQSGRNAAGLTGLQAQTREDLVDLFNEARSSIAELDIAQAQVGLSGLATAIEAAQAQQQIDFEQGRALTNDFGFAVDETGALRDVGGITGLDTLSRQEFLNSAQNQVRDDNLNERKFLYDASGNVVNDQGNIGYLAPDGGITFDPNSATKYYQGDDGRTYSNPNDAPAGVQLTEIPIRYQDPSIIAQRSEQGLSQAKEDTARIVSSGVGSYFQISDAGQLGDANYQYSQGVGIDVSNLAYADTVALDSQLGYEFVKGLNTDADLQGFLDSFNTVYFDNDGASYVAYKSVINDSDPDRVSNTAGYNFYEVVDGDGADIPLPDSIVEFVNSKTTQKITNDTGFFGLLTGYGLSHGENNKLQLSNNDVATLMESLDEYAIGEASIRKLKDSREIIEMFNQTAGDTPLKNAVLEGMMNNQNNNFNLSANSEDKSNVQGFGWKDKEIILQDVATMIDGLGEDDTWDSLLERARIHGGDGDFSKEGAEGYNSEQRLTEEFYKNYVPDFDPDTDDYELTTTMKFLMELDAYHEELYTNYATDTEVEAGQRYAQAREYFEATTALWLGNITGGQSSLPSAEKLATLFETPEETEARERAMGEYVEDYKSLQEQGVIDAQGNVVEPEKVDKGLFGFLRTIRRAVSQAL